MAAASFQDCIILFGDSLTERQDVPQALFERMSQAYARKMDVLNRGFGGFSSTTSLPLFDKIFAKKGENAPVVRLITLWFGTNDCVNFPNPRATHSSHFKANYEYFLHNLTSPESPYAVSETPVHILLITPPPPYDPQIPEPAKWVRSTERTLEFVDVVKDLGREWKAKEQKDGFKIEVLDLWEAMEDRAGGLGDGLEPFFHDGCHLTSKGYEVLWEEYRKIIKGPWKDCGLDWEDEDGLPKRVPLFKDQDAMREESVIELMALPKCRQ
ncbi:uncharacterized protein I303_107098 [Kwoniella dejecticola CBS 10117]|uniref:Uncharacterized protein n=1 Tax=Kwoniella dejecticola CBS 10117 TaxID=1296121 RepID=A0A1A5ZYQ3_9TREE|nr:uncharacterized protein I303_06499 [Kwoniella dejecticola CBS 10117]OBR82941.1 hypothetical protein I303_06499 [Kwoniella dejecticola CBS 10117]